MAIYAAKTFARHLSKSNYSHLASVRNLATCLDSSNNISLPPGSPDIESLFKRAWLDTNKGVTQVWLDSQSEGSNGTNFSLGSSFFPSTSIPDAVESLRARGWHLFKGVLSPSQVSLLIKETASFGLSEELVGQILGARDLARERCLSMDGLRFFYERRLLYESQLFSDISVDPVLTKIAQSYLGTSSLKCLRTGWMSVGRSTIQRPLQSAAAQAFHFDYDALRFLKVFIFLSDVDSESGAHQFYEGSHAKLPFSEKQLKRIPVNIRVSSSQLSDLYGAGALKTFEVPMGSVLIEDTTGFHRGNTMINGRVRDMLQLLYYDYRPSDLIESSRSKSRVDRLVDKFQMRISRLGCPLIRH